MELSQQQKVLIKNGVPGATDSHINYFAEVCRQRDMNPFAGQICLTVRGGRPVVVAQIDGLRSQAAKSGEYAGSDDPEYDDENGPTPVWCRVTVYRIVKGVRCPFTATLRYSEFAKGGNWGSMPYHMLAKCAEAAALRKGFPEQCGGLYEEGEDIPAPAQEEPAPQPAPEGPSLASRFEKVKAAFAPFGISESDLLADAKAKSVDDLTDAHFEKFFSWFNQCKEQEKSAQTN